MLGLYAFVVLFILTLVLLWLMHGYTAYLGNRDPADVFVMLLVSAAIGAIGAGVVSTIAAIFKLIAGIAS